MLQAISTAHSWQLASRGKQWLLVIHLYIDIYSSRGRLERKSKNKLNQVYNNIYFKVKEMQMQEVEFSRNFCY